MDEEKLKKSIIRRKKADSSVVAESLVMGKHIKEILQDDEDVFGYTMGRISLIDIVELCVAETGGDCHMVSSVWSLSQPDVFRLAALRDSGAMPSCQFIIDPSAYTRKQQSVEVLYHFFGEEAVRTVNTHAKFVVLRGKKKALSIISSMNFTRNPRIEQFQILHGDDIADLTATMVDEIFEKYTTEDNFTTQSKHAFERIRKGGDGKDLDGIELSLSTFSAL